MRTFRHIFLLIALTVLSFIANGQNCSSISGKKDKKRGIETVSGIITSKDFYSLLIQKETSFFDTSIRPKYLLFLNAASRVQFSDSTLNTTGKFQLKLRDGSTMSIESVSFINS